jgi:hypothetical protein
MPLAGWACTDLFEKPQHEKLLTDATFNPPIFSLVNTFKQPYNLNI